MFSMFLMLTLYMQQVLGYSAMETGVAYLAVAGTAIIWSGVAAQLVTRVGVKPVLVAGMTFLTAGLIFFTQVSVGGSYVTDLLPGFLLIGVGIGFSFVPITIAALAGVEPAEAGLASGLINTSQQIGGALGIAALSTIATSEPAMPCRPERRCRAPWSTDSPTRSSPAPSSRVSGSSPPSRSSGGTSSLSPRKSWSRRSTWPLSSLRTEGAVASVAAPSVD